jgi:prepilin-type N-terminal cleavage/methylation domain-containing protein
MSHRSKSGCGKVWRDGGFTLVELTIVLVIVLALAAAAIPRVGMMIESSKKAATLEEMSQIRRAIVGDPRLSSGGQLVDTGYEGDVGSPPPNLLALTTRPVAVPQYNRFTRTGWNGPYINPSNLDYLTDAWGVAYQYDKDARTITSTGSTEQIVISF